LIYEEIQVAFIDQDPNYQHSALTVLSALLQSKGSGSEIIRVRNWLI